MTNMRPGRGAEQIIVRLPDGLKDRLREAAEANGRSLNAEAVARLLDSFDKSVETSAPMTLPIDFDERKLEDFSSYGEFISKTLDSVAKKLMELAKQPHPNAPGSETKQQSDVPASASRRKKSA